LAHDETLLSIDEEAFEGDHSATLTGPSVTVVLAGMKIPPNYGQEYTAGFEALYQNLEYRLPLIPFFLDGVAGSSSLNQVDGFIRRERAIGSSLRRSS
jgi:hypothetical protein